MPAKYIPKGFHTVNPYLTVSDAAKLIDFMKRAFDAEEMMCMRDEGGAIRHAQLKIGDSMIEASDSNEQWTPMHAALHLYVPDTDATYQRAIEAGGTSLFEPADMFYGERGAGVRDPVGNNWYIATLVEELSEEEIDRRAKEYMQGQKTG